MDTTYLYYLNLVPDNIDGLAEYENTTSRLVYTAIKQLATIKTVLHVKTSLNIYI